MKIHFKEKKSGNNIGLNKISGNFSSLSNSGAIDEKMDASVHEEILSFRMQGLSFPSKLNWGSYTVSIAKTASR